MASHSTDDRPLQVLKHEAVPGYLKASAVAIAVVAIYLAVILISSPGSAGGHGAHGGSAKSQSDH